MKAGAKRLRLVKLTSSLGAGATKTVTAKVDSRDSKLLKKAKATASISASSTVGGTTAAKTVTVAMNS